jgi:hypothetical protein
MLQSKDDAYYIESVRVFEKAFGIDRLLEDLQMLQRKRRIMEENPERRHYIFTAKDLAEQRAALDEFQTRHSTIADRIEETYKLGTTMMDYLEK